MKVLVTGANGFIGSNLCAGLIGAGYDVNGLVRPSSDLGFVADLEPLTLFKGDVSEPDSLKPALRGVSIVYHVAGYSSDWGSWAAFRAGNVDGVRAVMDAARAARKVRRVVHLSSVSVYGFPGGVDIAEDTPFTPRPGDPYITTKAEGERLALGYQGKGLEVTVIRPATVFGRNDRTTTLQLAPALMARKFGYVDGGRYVMAPTYVENLVELIRLAGEKDGAPGQAFNAVDDGRVTWRDFIEWMCEDLGCRKPLFSAPRGLAWPLAAALEGVAKAVRMKDSPMINKFRVRAVMRDAHYSAEKAKRCLGYRQKVSTRDGIRRTAAWYRRYAGLDGQGA